jgi:hypothetical protein
VTNLRPFLGKELIQLFGDTDFLAEILPRGVCADGPLPAVERIRNAYGLAENFMFSAVPIFTKISEFAHSSKLNLLIHAPHSHWAPGSAVIYRYLEDSDRYLIGLHEIHPEMLYHPVSFFQCDGVVYPYEWADDSIEFSDEFWRCHYDGLNQIFSSCIANSDPIGVGVDFRFRHGLHAGKVKSPGTIEFPVEVAGQIPNDDFSLIVRKHDFEHLTLPRRQIVNVAWPCISDSQFGLPTEGLAALHLLRSALADIKSQDERVVLLRSLEGRVG